MKAIRNVLMLSLVLVLALGGAYAIASDDSDAAPAVPSPPITGVIDTLVDDMLSFEVPEELLQGAVTKEGDVTVTSDPWTGTVVLKDGAAVVFSKENPVLNLAENACVIIMDGVTFRSADSVPFSIVMQPGSSLSVGGMALHGAVSVGFKAVISSSSELVFGYTFEDKVNGSFVPLPAQPNTSYTGSMKIDLTKAYAEKSELRISDYTVGTEDVLLSEQIYGMSADAAAPEVSMSVAMDVDELYKSSAEPPVNLTLDWLLGYLADPEQTFDLLVDLDVYSLINTVYAEPGKVSEIIILNGVDLSLGTTDGTDLFADADATSVSIESNPDGDSTASGSFGLELTGPALSASIGAESSLVLSFEQIYADMFAFNGVHDMVLETGRTSLDVSADLYSFMEAFGKVSALTPADYQGALDALTQLDAEGAPVIDVTGLLMGLRLSIVIENFRLISEDAVDTDMSDSFLSLTFTDAGVSANMSAEAWNGLEPGCTSVTLNGLELEYTNLSVSDSPGLSSSSSTVLGIAAIELGGSVGLDCLEPLIAALLVPSADPNAAMQNILSMLMAGIDVDLNVTVRGLDLVTADRDGTLRAPDVTGELDPATDLKPSSEWYLVTVSKDVDVRIDLIALDLTVDTVSTEPAAGEQPDEDFVGLGMSADGISIIVDDKREPVVADKAVDGKADIMRYRTANTTICSISGIDADLGMDVAGLIGFLMYGGPVCDPTFGMVLNMSVTGMDCDYYDDTFRIDADFPDGPYERRLIPESEQMHFSLGEMSAVLDRTADLPLVFAVRDLSYDTEDMKTEYHLMEYPAPGEDHEYSIVINKNDTVFNLSSAVMDFALDLSVVPEGAEPGTEGYDDAVAAATEPNVRLFFGFISSLLSGPTDDPGAYLQDLKYYGASRMTVSGVEFQKVEHSAYEDTVMTYDESLDYRSFVILDPDRYGEYDTYDVYGSLGTFALMTDGDETSIGLDMSLDHAAVNQKRVNDKYSYDEVSTGDIEVTNLFVNGDLESDALPRINAMLVNMIMSNLPVYGEVQPTEPPAPAPVLPDAFLKGLDAGFIAGFDALSVDSSLLYIYTANMPFNPEMPDVRYYAGDTLLVNRTLLKLTDPETSSDAAASITALLRTDSVPAQGDVPAKDTVTLEASLDTVPGMELEYQVSDVDCDFVWLPDSRGGDEAEYELLYPYAKSVVEDKCIVIVDPTFDLNITAEDEDLSTADKFIAAAQADIAISAEVVSEHISTPVDPDGPDNDKDANGEFLPGQTSADDYLNTFVEFCLSEAACSFSGPLKDGFTAADGILKTPADLFRASSMEFNFGTCSLKSGGEVVSDYVLALEFGDVSMGMEYNVSTGLPMFIMNAGSILGSLDDGTGYTDCLLDDGRTACIGPDFVFGVKNGDLLVVLSTVDVVTGSVEAVPVTVPSAIFGQTVIGGILPADRAAEIVRISADTAQINGMNVPVGTLVRIGEDSKFTSCTVGGEPVTDACAILKKGDVCEVSEGMLITLHGFEGETSALYRPMGTDLTAIPDMILPEGYTWCGWYADAETTVPAAGVLNGPTDLYAKYTVNEYNVTFDTLGGTGAAEKMKVLFGTPVTLPSDITKEGFTLAGWMYGTQKLGFIIESMPADNVILTAVWNQEISDKDVIREEGTAKVASSESSMQIPASVTDRILGDKNVERLVLDVNGTKIDMGMYSLGLLYKDSVPLVFTSGITEALDKDLSDKVDSDMLEFFGQPKMYVGLHVDGCKDGINSNMGIVKVTVPYDGDTAAKVFYIEDTTGAVIPMENCVYDPVAGTLTFETYHFSTFAVVPVESFNVSVDSQMTGGQIAVQEKADVGDRVTVEVTPDEGKKLVRLFWTNGTTEFDFMHCGYFPMPEYDVTVCAEFEDITYTVSVADPVGGSVNVTSTVVTAGTEVQVNVSPDDGFVLKSLVYYLAGGEPVVIEGDSFVMPAGNVTVKAVFSVEYTLTIDPEITGGKLILPAEAGEGTSVTVTVQPDKGMKLDKLIYTVDGGEPVVIEGDSFVMPAGNVTVSAVFVEDPSAGGNTLLIVGAVIAVLAVIAVAVFFIKKH